MINKTSVAREFDRRAHTYDQCARVQHSMNLRLIERLEQMNLEPASILEVGCGTGTLTELLVARFPTAHITAIDLAPAMIAWARSRIINTNVTFEIGDAENLPLKEMDFDLVISNATIQWFTNPQASMDRLTRRLAIDGVMLHATFGPDTFKELFASYRNVEDARHRPRSVRGLTLASAIRWVEILQQCGLRQVSASRRHAFPRYPNARAFLRELKGTGACYSPTPEPDLTMLAEVIHRYDIDYAKSKDEGIVATYEIIELLAKR